MTRKRLAVLSGVALVVLITGTSFALTGEWDFVSGYDDENDVLAYWYSEADEATGLRILRHALEAPARQIALNSGADPGVVVERMRAGSGAFGFDAQRGEYRDLVEAGIIDPTKVVRLALENAVSGASVLLLAEATLTEIEEPKKDERGPGELM